jgi:hypothetical protein
MKSALILFLTVTLALGIITPYTTFADSDDDQHEGKVNKKNRVWTGDGPPLPKLGKVGDLYIDNHNGSYNIYKKTAKNTWTDVIDIQGPPGSQGAQGLTSLILTSVEPVGSNCTDGGVKIMTGVDDNNDGSLETSEVDATNYICNGVAGPPGQPGSFGDLNAKIADKNSEISSIHTRIISLETTLTPLQSQLDGLEVQLGQCLANCQANLSVLNFALANCIVANGGYLPDGSVPNSCLDEKAAVDSFVCSCSSPLQAAIDAQTSIVEPLENQLVTLNSDLSLCQIDLQTLESLERLFGSN